MLFSLKVTGIFSFLEDSVPSLISLAASGSDLEKLLKRVLMVHGESNKNYIYIALVHFSSLDIMQFGDDVRLVLVKMYMHAMKTSLSGNDNSLEETTKSLCEDMVAMCKLAMMSQESE